MELSIYNIEGKDTGKKVALNEAIYAIEPNDHAIYLDVKQYLANQRQGTHKAKQRSEMSGSTKKLGRQKGGGGARRGDINSPLMHGGARVFGPVPRDYGFKLNKKLKQLARKSALTYKAKSSEIMLIDNIDFAAPKTKNITALASALNLTDKKLLIILSDQNKNVYLSARNLEKVNVITVSQLSTYSILNCSALLMTEAAVAAIDQHFNV